MKPTLSIIIPVYNVEQYLEKCLDSVLVDNQFAGQVICVDDGSTDGSLAILEEYAKRYSNIEIIKQSHMRQSVARNTGLNKATGEYIFYIDSDDWVFPGSIDQVLSRIDGEEVIYFNGKTYYEQNQTWDRDCSFEDRSHMNGIDYFAYSMERKSNFSFVCLWGGFYSRDFLIGNNLYNEPGIYHEDTYFTPQVLLKASDVSVVDVYVYAYRKRKNGSTSTSVGEKYIKDQLYVIRNLYKLFKADTRLTRAFYDYLSILCTETIGLSYSNEINVDRFWRLSDSIIYTRCANDQRERKIAKLAVISRKLAYRYSQNTLPSWMRKCVNRFF